LKQTAAHASRLASNLLAGFAWISVTAAKVARDAERALRAEPGTKTTSPPLCTALPGPDGMEVLNRSVVA
jgi:hypothetical protein